MKAKILILTDADRYEQLSAYYDKQLSRDDKYEISRPNFNFLLLSYNKYLKLQMEHEALIREYQKIKRLQGIEHSLTNMTERKVKRISQKNGWNHG